MAVTAPALAVDLRLILDSTEYPELPGGQRDNVSRVLATAGAMVAKYAPAAPEAIADEATVRLACYLYDVPASDVRFVQSPLRQSGAGALLSPYRARRLVGVAAS